MDPTDPRRGPAVQILRNLEIYARDRQIILLGDDPVEYLISLIDGDGSNSEDRLEAQEEFGNYLHHASAEDIEVINDRISSILMQLRDIRHAPE